MMAHGPIPDKPRESSGERLHALATVGYSRQDFDRMVREGTLAIALGIPYLPPHWNGASLPSPSKRRVAG